MKTIYCISGLGADEKVFSKLKIEGYQLQFINWLKPFRNETLQQYAARMRESITENDPILIGLSFGGILCTEIAKQIPVKKIIIISSIKSSVELPFWMRAVAKLSLHKIFPLRSTKLTAPFQNRFLGVYEPDEKMIAGHYRKHADPYYTRWAVDKVVNWKNDWQHPHLFHLHGDNDKMFPIKKIKPTYTLHGGGHFMIMNMADEVSTYINLILNAD
jgi:esterase/lipase